MNCHPPPKKPFVMLLLRLISYVEIYCSISCVSGALPPLSGSNSSCSTTEQQVLTGSKCTVFEADVPEGGRTRDDCVFSFMMLITLFYLTTMAFDLRVRWLGRLPARYHTLRSYYSQRTREVIEC